MDHHFKRLLEASESADPIYQATSYWKNYEKRIFQGISEVDFSLFRSGKYPVFEHFGFSERKYKQLKKFKDKWRILGSAFKNVFMRSRHFMPYDLDIRDIQLMAYRHAELMSQISGLPHPSQYSISTYGHPDDQFKVGQNIYNILSLTYYIRLCFVHQFAPLKGDEIIVELGSGSCHQLEIIKKLYPNITILCFDLPGPLYLGEKFITGVFGSEQVVSSSECVQWKDLSKLEKGKIHFFGNWQSDIVKGFSYDLFWNAASFGEMEPQVVQHYLQVFSPGAKAVFLLQASNGKEQFRVKDPITFKKYNEWLSGFEQKALQPAFKIHKPMTASGGYSQAVWVKQ